MHSNAMGDRKSSPSAKLFRLSHVRKLRECEQVAAVCYRRRGSDIDFLLVRTGSDRWTFPKGGVEPGLTHAQAAALEAFEEAGVHGRMEEVPFIRYVRRKRRGRGATSDAEKEIGTSAHLCEVLRLVEPQETDRDPSWFTVEKTKKKLLEGRTAEFGIELIRVVDRAVARIQRESQTVAGPADALQRVQFEASPIPSRPYDPIAPRSGKTVIAGRHRAKVLQLGPTLVVETSREVRRVAKPSLSAGKKSD